MKIRRILSIFLLIGISLYCHAQQPQTNAKVIQAFLNSNRVMMLVAESLDYSFLGESLPEIVFKTKNPYPPDTRFSLFQNQIALYSAQSYEGKINPESVMEIKSIKYRTDASGMQKATLVFKFGYFTKGRATIRGYGSSPDVAEDWEMGAHWITTQFPGDKKRRYISVN